MIRIFFSIMVLVAVSGCVTTPGQDNALAPLRTAKIAEVKPESSAETSAELSAELTLESATDTLAEETLTTDEMSALPEAETLILSAITPPQPEPEPEPEPAPPPAPQLDPASFVGTDQGVLSATLGEPVFRRREGIAEVWQYRMQHCIVDFVLPDGETITAFHPRHRKRGMAYDQQQCMQDMAILAGI